MEKTGWGTKHSSETASAGMAEGAQAVSSVSIDVRGDDRGGGEKERGGGEAGTRERERGGGHCRRGCNAQVGAAKDNK